MLRYLANVLTGLGWLGTYGLPRLRAFRVSAAVSHCRRNSLCHWSHCRFTVRVWMVADDRFRQAVEQDGFSCSLSTPNPKVAGRRATGRNSNLDQIPEFKDRPLYWTEVASPAEALAVAAKLK
jgi:hypothetical protein